MVKPNFRKSVGLEEITEKTKRAARALNDLISSLALAVEEKVSLQHQISNLARESEYMIDRIDGIAKKNQKKVLMAYREFLKDNLEAVDRRLKDLG
jgi:signal transduction histidine kinase